MLYFGLLCCSTCMHTGEAMVFGSTLVMLRDGQILRHNTPCITGIEYVKLQQGRMETNDYR